MTQDSPRLWPDPTDVALDDPHAEEWAAGGFNQNWQIYIGERTRKVWKGLSREVKQALASDADEFASREDWG